jgi:hypothetical protein
MIVCSLHIFIGKFRKRLFYLEEREKRWYHVLMIMEVLCTLDNKGRGVWGYECG